MAAAESARDAAEVAAAMEAALAQLLVAAEVREGKGREGRGGEIYTVQHGLCAPVVSGGWWDAGGGPLCSKTLSFL